MAKHIKRSVVPIYLIGVVWLGYALLFPLRTVSQYVLCGGVSLLAFVVGKAIFPDKVFEMPGEPEKKQAPKEEKTKEEPKKEKPKSTGNPEIDRLIQERDRAVSEMRRLNDNIPDEKIS